jgi:hypothetical protein
MDRCHTVAISNLLGTAATATGATADVANLRALHGWFARNNADIVERAHVSCVQQPLTIDRGLWSEGSHPLYGFLTCLVSAIVGLGGLAKWRHLFLLATNVCNTSRALFSAPVDIAL